MTKATENFIYSYSYYSALLLQYKICFLKNKNKIYVLSPCTVLISMTSYNIIIGYVRRWYVSRFYCIEKVEATNSSEESDKETHRLNDDTSGDISIAIHYILLYYN